VALCAGLALYAAAATLIVSLVSSPAFTARVPAGPARRYIDEQALEAARVQALAIAAAGEARSRLGLGLDAEADRYGTGLIGEAYSGITTTLGQIEAKRSAATPEAAALLVRLLREAGVSSGAVVAVNASGSFPGFALAAIAACGALDAEARLFLSLGSSSWGANNADFNVVDIVSAAASAFPPEYDYSIVGVSPGGSDDRGLDMDSELLESMIARLEAGGLRVSSPSSLEESVATRAAALDGDGAAAALVNIGGNYASSGADLGLSLATGVVSPGSAEVPPGPGLMQSFMRARKPVVQLLNVRRLYESRGLVFDAPPWDARNARVLYRRTSYALGALLLLPPVALAVVFAARTGRRGRKSEGP